MHGQADKSPCPADRRTTSLQLRTPWRDDRRPVALAARSEISGGRCPRRARLSEGRERVFRRLEGAASEAARSAVRGDEGTDQGGREFGAGSRRRLALLVGIPARRAVSDLVPQAGAR